MFFIGILFQSQLHSVERNENRPFHHSMVTIFYQRMFQSKSLFAGGIHPTDGFDKALTGGKNIIKYIPNTVRISLKQGLGPACKPVVHAGDHVMEGQLIGEAGHFLSAHVHASVTGTVTAVDETACEIAVEDCRLPDTDCVYYKEFVEISYSKEELVRLLSEGGLVGMGGAGFPTAVKYATKEKISHLLINGAECEPFLTCDEHLILEQGMAILNGARALKAACGAQKVIICMEDNKVHCKEALDKLLAGHGREVEIRLLPTKYPQGSEKQLIQAVMGVEIPVGKLPAEVGAMVSNIQTAKAAADMIFGGFPSTSRVITITGDVAHPGNYLVPIGTDIGELVALAGDVKSKDNKVILGGPMTGRLLGFCLDAAKMQAEKMAVVSKVSGGLVVLDGNKPEVSNCIKCGRCLQVCPAGIKPVTIEKNYLLGNLIACKALYATECIACGSCSYICPARRELAFHVVSAREAVRAKIREEAAQHA